MPWGQVQRLDGQDAIRANFHAEFDDLRADGGTQTIMPRRRNLKVLGDTAVLTFELGGETLKVGENLSRRTVVLRRFADGWRIVHLHASIAVIETLP
jgi:ketosteroid isomerase-like protein